MQGIVDDAGVAGGDIAQRYLLVCWCVDGCKREVVFSFHHPSRRNFYFLFGLRGLGDERSFPVSRTIVEFRMEIENASVAVDLDAQMRHARGFVEGGDPKREDATRLFREHEVDAKRMKTPSGHPICRSRLEARPFGALTDPYFVDRIPCRVCIIYTFTPELA